MSASFLGQAKRDRARLKPNVVIFAMKSLRRDRGTHTIETTTSMADAERRAGETTPADRAPHRACPGRWSPLADYFAAAGFFTSLALGFLAALFGSFRSTVLRSSWWSGPPPFAINLTPFHLALRSSPALR